MTDTSNVVPPQPRWRIVTRRVRARRFALATLVSGFGLLVSFLFDHGALVSRQSGLAFWLAAGLAGVTFVCALLAGFFLLTERPRQVKVLEKPLSDTHVIHLTPKE